MNYTRKQNGEFTKKPSTANRIMRLVIFLGIMSAIMYGAYLKGNDTVEEKQVSELETVMSREDLKIQYELMAREVLLKEKKAKAEAEYHSAMQQINAELEEVRSQKVGF